MFVSGFLCEAQWHWHWFYPSTSFPSAEWCRICKEVWRGFSHGCSVWMHVWHGKLQMCVCLCAPTHICTCMDLISSWLNNTGALVNLIIHYTVNKNQTDAVTDRRWKKMKYFYKMKTLWVCIFLYPCYHTISLFQSLNSWIQNPDWHL